MHWKLKSAAFKTLEAVPFGRELHYLAQRHVTRTWPRREVHLMGFVELVNRRLQTFAKFSTTPTAEATFLEIGAGRDLAVPVALRLLGARAVTAVDISSLARLDLVNHAAKALAKAISQTVAPFQSWADLKAFGVEYRAPHDIVANPNIGPVDAFISNEVLEHVPPDALQGMLSATHTFLVQGGLAMHSIDYSDHYARGGGVSRYNFLTYSDRDWARYNSSFQYVNRLRHSQYLAMHERAGLEILEVETYAEELPPQIADNLAPQFQDFSSDDLKIMRAHIISRRT